MVRSHLVPVDTFFPSSKTCSCCEVVHENLPLLERVFRCDACGLVLDRGENASCTLAVLAIAVAGGGPWTGDVKRPWRGRQTRVEAACHG